VLLNLGKLLRCRGNGVLVLLHDGAPFSNQQSDIFSDAFSRRFAGEPAGRMQFFWAQIGLSL